VAKSEQCVLGFDRGQISAIGDFTTFFVSGRIRTDDVLGKPATTLMLPTPSSGEAIPMSVRMPGFSIS
jgi:hypothetical protein